MKYSLFTLFSSLCLFYSLSYHIIAHTEEETSSVENDAISEDSDIVTITEFQTPNQELRSLVHDLQQLKADLDSQQKPFIFAENPQKKFTGLGYAASKIYYSPEPIAIGMAAEWNLFSQQSDNDNNGSRNPSRSDTLRVAPVLGAQLSDKIYFNSKFSFDSGGAETDGTTSPQKGQVVVDFAYLDLMLLENYLLGLRVGKQLIPFGLINISNEPMDYYTVERSELETNVIPSTWSENGLALWGNFDHFHYQAGLFSSPDSEGFRTGQFIKGGIQGGQNAKSEDIMGVLRLDFISDLATLGGSFLYGNTAQKRSGLSFVPLTMWEIHGSFQWRGWEMAGIYTEGELTEVDSLNALQPTESFSSQAKGFRANLAYDFVTLLNHPIEWLNSLLLFIEHTDYDMNAQVGLGKSRDLSLHKTVTAVGLNYSPLKNVRFKSEYQFRKNQLENEHNIFALGAAVIF